jgi:hypothetical protein
MEYPGFCGQSYASPSFQLDSERCLNLFAEVVNIPGVSARSKIVLRRRPGYNLLQTLPDSPGRGIYELNGRVFAVAGSTFYELTSGATYLARGTVTAGSTPVQFASTQTQILVLAADGAGYVFTLASNAFTPITATGWPSPVTSITSLDTYFVALGPSGSNKFSISGLLDGLSWSGLDFGSSQEPDNAVAIVQAHLYLWIFGRNETILFQDSGNSSFPFTRVAGSQIEQGCAAVGSVAIVDNTVFWVGSDARGSGVVYRAEGLLPTRISTHAIEAAIQSYSRIDDAVAVTYQDAGQLFYGLHFPTAGTAWYYSVATGMWHERAYWAASSGTWSEDLGRYHAFGFNKHLAVDFSSGNVYEMTRAVARDNGAALRWLRVAPFINAENMRLFFHWFELLMQTGGGLASGADPQAMIRWSNDGGATWSNYRQVSCGATGAYLTRAITRMCGSGRNRAFEVSGTDPIPDLCIVGANVGVEKGRS